MICYSNDGFILETSKDNFQVVSAERVSFDSGSVVFFDVDDEGDSRIHSAYAAGQWLTVVEGGDQ